MSKVPDKIYLHEGALGSPCTSYRKTTNEDIEYIRKDALIEQLRKEADKAFISFARENLGLEAREKGLALEQLIKYIETL